MSSFTNWALLPEALPDDDPEPEEPELEDPDEEPDPLEPDEPEDDPEPDDPEEVDELEEPEPDVLDVDPVFELVDDEVELV